MGDERANEKEGAKREEKWEEKWHRDPVGSMIGAVVLMWAGVVLLAVNLGFVETFTDFLARLSIQPYHIINPIPTEVMENVPFLNIVNLDAWQVFFLGAGVILVIEIIIRLLIPAYRRQVLGTFIGAIAFFALGLGTWTIVGPLIVVAVGVSILIRGLSRRR